MSDAHDEPRAEGWYDDPEGNKNVERYWNGTSWSGAPRQKRSQLTAGVVIWTAVALVALFVFVWWFFFS